MVWSDAEIAALSRQFVTVADEVYMLYPEDAHNLARVAGRPEHQFFKKFGEAMPKGDWHHPGTKQGIYMIGPQGEYLEGRFAAGSEPDDIRARLQRALQRWDVLRKEKGYANEAVPAVVSTLPPEVAGKEFVLRIHSRDLPRGAEPECQDAVRFDADEHARGGFLGYLRWAWNENWLAVDRAAAFGPGRGEGEHEVDPAVVKLLARRALVDNVRGQAGDWPSKAVRKATLRVRETGRTGEVGELEYRGEFELDDGERRFVGALYGRAQLDLKTARFSAFDLLALGMRSGAHRFNQRRDDPGPAPLGIAIGLYLPPR